MQNLATLTGEFITKEFGLNLEKASITVIQIDEAALREVLPFRKSEHAFYLDWAVHSFRITNCGVQDTTQIHTRMCSTNFNDIIHSIIDMDVDVITIENFRSNEKLRSLFRERVKYGAGPDYGRISLESSLAVHRFPWENIRGRISYCMNDNFHSKVLKTIKNLHLKELTACDSSEGIFKSVMCGMQEIIAYKPFANKESSPEDAQVIYVDVFHAMNSLEKTCLTMMTSHG